MGTNVMANEVKTPIQNYSEKCCMKMWHFRFPLVVFRVLATREKIEGEWNINHKPMWHYIPCLWPEWLLYYSSHLHMYGRKEKKTKKKTSAVWKRQANFRYINFHRRERKTFARFLCFVIQIKYLSKTELGFLLS